MSNERLEREDRAFDALIISHRLRDRDFNDLNDLPPLTDSQRKLMESLPEDFAERLLMQANTTDIPCDDEVACEYADELEEIELVGMNRADEMDEETKQKLEEARRLVIEAMKAKKKPKGKSDA